MINGRTILIDLSSYQRYYQLDFNRWADAGIDGVILKNGEGAVTEELWNKLSKSYIPIKAMYGWHFPLWDKDTQIAFYSNEINVYQPHFYALDIEHWWKDFTQYVAAIQGKITWGEVAVIPPEVIDLSARAVYFGLQACHPKLYLPKYTGEWYVRSYCKPMVKWINTGPNWLAAYPDRRLRRVTWSEIYPNEGYSPIYDKNDLAQLYPYQGFPADSWDLWQFASTIIIPGEDYALDCNVFNGTLDDLKTKCGLKVEPPPIPVEQPFKNYLPHISK
jgi:hypothetical protein